MNLEIADKPSLKDCTSLRLGGSAIIGVTLKSEAGLDSLPEILAGCPGAPFVIGRGSNILAREGELALALIGLKTQELPEIIREDSVSATVSVSAAFPLPLLLHFTSEHGLGGLEGLMGIPGSVGGAVSMNAGSFGTEIGNFIEQITVFTPENGLLNKKADEIKSEYRKFSFSGEEKASYHIIWKVSLRLPKDDRQRVREKMSGIIRKKQETQPICAASAGCIFKNPAPDAPAGMLLDKCGFKGKALGGMMFSPMHANFLINRGNGNSEEALELISVAQAAVKENFGHDLQLEVKVIP